MARIVLAENDRRVRAALEGYLSEVGHDVDVVDCGAQVIESVELAEYTHVVVCEAELPDCSGLDLLRAIRARFPAVHVIVVTSFRDELLARRARNLGAVAVLTKPFSPTRLSEAVHLASGASAREPN